LIKEIANRYPIFILVIFGVIISFGILFWKFTLSIRVILCIIVGVLSILIYFRNKSLTETYLSLFLGLLTVFSITWDVNGAIIFTVALFSFYLIILFLSSIKLSSDLETILTQAANFISENNGHAAIYKRLRKIAEQSTHFRQLQLIERAESVRFLVFIRVPIDNFIESIEIIESIKVIYQIHLSEALMYYKNNYLLSIALYGRPSKVADIEKIHTRYNQLSLTPSDFMEIFNYSYSSIIKKTYSIDSYFDKFKNLVDMGYDKNRIIDNLK